MGRIRDVAKKGPKPSFFATASGVPFTRFHAHTRKQWVSSKLGASVQIRAIGSDAKITYGGTFNLDTKNIHLFLLAWTLSIYLGETIRKLSLRVDKPIRLRM